VKPNALVINESDNVAVALEDIGQGESVYLADGRVVEAVSDVPFSHKIALRRFTRGEDIIKYGEVIGQAKEDIGTGDWVHTHNLVIED
jgi:hypothetical protein